jgi:hypothetical protein
MIRNGRFFKLVALMLAILLPVGVIAQECGESRAQGENDAAYQHSSAGWLSALGGGLLGTVVFVALYVSAQSD